MIEQLQLWQAHLFGGRALDIGAGSGNTSFWLADAGYSVDAIEPGRFPDPIRDPLAGSITHHKINALEFDYPEQAYAVVIASAVLHFIGNEHHTGLARQIMNALMPGGMLFAAVFTTDDPSADERQLSHFEQVAYYFAPGELMRLFEPLDVLFYDESRRSAPESSFGFRAGATLVARQRRLPAQSDLDHQLNL